MRMVLEKARHIRYQTKDELSRKKKTVIDTNNVFLPADKGYIIVAM